MIIKNFELDKINIKNFNLFLLYGDNQGFKDEIVEKICQQKRLKKTLYFEKEVLSNIENFLNSISTRSFFENEKIIVIKNATDKLKEMINDIYELQNSDITVILISDLLDKKSKIRNFFEKTKNVICIPFYPDEHKDLNMIANNFFKKKGIKISQQTINLIIDRANQSRQHLNNELKKIENFSLNKKEIKDVDIIKLTNLGKNYEISELVETCLAKNQNKLLKIMNENHFSNEDVILILRIFLTKTKRLLNLAVNSKPNKNFDEAISKFRPPIFWKEKPYIKQQLINWSESKLKKLINEINEIELLSKKNSQISQSLLLNFIFENSKTVNN
jgi:DNA polymerase-3 subunit delta